MHLCTYSVITIKFNVLMLLHSKVENGNHHILNITQLFGKVSKLSTNQHDTERHMRLDVRLYQYKYMMHSLYATVAMDMYDVAVHNDNPRPIHDSILQSSLVKWR